MCRHLLHGRLLLQILNKDHGGRNQWQFVIDNVFVSPIASWPYLSITSICESQLHLSAKQQLAISNTISIMGPISVMAVLIASFKFHLNLQTFLYNTSIPAGTTHNIQYRASMLCAVPERMLLVLMMFVLTTRQNENHYYLYRRFHPRMWCIGDTSGSE